nr:hydrolase [uncultured Capnocytophaga sp.]
MKLIKLPFLLLIGSIFMISCGDNKDEKKIVQKEEKPSIEILQDSIRKLSEELSDARYFDIQYNEDSQYFFYENGIEDSEEFVRQQLMATNITKDENHPLISYRPRRNAKFQINKIKLLNHRWVICDFSDGLDWGELLLKITLNDDKTLSFEVLDQTLYVSEQKP